MLWKGPERRPELIPCDACGLARWWNELREAEFFVRKLSGAVGVLAVDDDGDFDFGRRDELDVDAPFAEAIKQPRGDTGMRPHPDTDDTQLRDAGFGDQARGLDFLYQRRQQLGRGGQIGLVHREGNIGRSMLG